MTRVLHVISSLDPRAGGPSTALAGLAPAQVRAGLDVSVIATWLAGEGAAPDVAALRSAGVKVTLVGPATGKFMRHPQLADEVDDAVAAADVVHVHALWEEIQHHAAVAARRRRVPYVFRPCGMLDPWSLGQRKWVKKLYLAWRLRADLNGAAAIHYTSDLERELAGRLGLSAPRLVEPNGVDLAEFDPLPPAGAFRAMYPQIGERKLILFLSRVHPKKGLDLLIPAFARAKLDDAVLVIAGPGDADYVAALQRTAREHSVEGRVVFTGMLYGRDRVAALADADLFALPSHQENFGIAVVEALAAGTPVVVSDQVNIHREITAAGVGAVVPMDEAALASALSDWIGDDALREGAGRRAPSFVRDHYDWDQIARRWMGHYQRLAPLSSRSER